MMKIAVIGLGYVGLSLAVEFSRKGNQVTGFDISSSRIQELVSGVDKTLEVDPTTLASSSVTFTDNKDLLAGNDVYIVTVPTPVDKDNQPDLTPLVDASVLVGMSLAPGATVVYESTVWPGCTEEVCVPILEEVSGFEFGTDFFVGYSPERVNPGDKTNTLTKITKVVSGCCPRTQTLLVNLYNQIIEPGTYLASSIKVAEAAKIIENTQRDVNIGLMNELSTLFSKLDINFGDVLDAAGTKWNFLKFSPGLVGGHCIGVDPYYLMHKAHQASFSLPVISAARVTNELVPVQVGLRIVRELTNKGVDPKESTVGVLGITFKENCPDTRNSKVVALIKVLESYGITVVVEDPWASEKDVLDEYGISLTSIQPGSVDAVLIAVAHNQYKSLLPFEITCLTKSLQPLVVDLKSVLPAATRQEFESVITL